MKKQHGRESRPGRETTFTTFVADIKPSSVTDAFDITIRDMDGNLDEIMHGVPKHLLVPMLYDLNWNGLHMVTPETIEKAREFAKDE